MFKFDITKVPKIADPLLNQSKPIRVVENRHGESWHLTQIDPDTFYRKELFAYPDEHHYLGKVYFGS
jgi:hypothetical protein